MSQKHQGSSSTHLGPNITVWGVGGAGNNAVNNMITSKLMGANFVVANTDAQALEMNAASRKIQLGEALTKGLGAGAVPEIGKAAAEEAMAEIKAELENANMLFITAGMGGGTGTGATPVVARAAKEMGILTVAVVTKPFHFEGAHRMRLAEAGIAELFPHVDTLIIIPNQNLFRIANDKTTFAQAFQMADNVLHSGVRGITDLITMPGLINLDFADISTIMSGMGKAMMGTGEASGENRALRAAEAAISNPLLDISSMKGAKGVLINITGGSDMTLFEVDEAANRVREEIENEANIIFGSAFNQDLDGTLRVSVVATGIGAEHAPEKPAQQQHYISIPKVETIVQDTTYSMDEEETSEQMEFFIPEASVDPKNFNDNDIETEGILDEPIILELSSTNQISASKSLYDEIMQSDEEDETQKGWNTVQPAEKNSMFSLFDMPAFLRRKK